MKKQKTEINGTTTSEVASVDATVNEYLVEYNKYNPSEATIKKYQELLETALIRTNFSFRKEDEIFYNPEIVDGVVVRGVSLLRKAEINGSFNLTHLTKLGYFITNGNKEYKYVKTATVEETKKLLFYFYVQANKSKFSKDNSTVSTEFKKHKNEAPSNEDTERIMNVLREKNASDLNAEFFHQLRDEIVASNKETLAAITSSNNAVIQSHTSLLTSFNTIAVQLKLDIKSGISEFEKNSGAVKNVVDMLIELAKNYKK